MNYDVNELVTLLNAELKGVVVEKVSGLTPFLHSTEDSVTFAADEKYYKKISETKAKVVIVPDVELDLEKDKCYIVVKDNPRYLMHKILSFFKRKTKKISERIEATAIIGENTEIAFNSYIGHDSIIGDNVKIYPNVFIGEAVKIGKNSIIYPNVSIREFVTIGDNCIIQAGAVIGGDGFGFVKVLGQNMKIEQIGGVIIENDVEVGANTTIDRGAIGNTVIKKFTKIDNLVQIAHNVIIGENCLIVSQVGIAGSTEIGDNVTLAGQVGIAGHLKIGNNVMLGAQSGVTGNIEDNKILSGNPPVDQREHLKIKAALKKLPETLKLVKKIEKNLNLDV